MDANLKRQIPFFVIVYGSPFLALFAVETYSTLYLPQISFMALLLYALAIFATYMTILIGYRLNQPRIQRWRMERAEKRELINSRMSQQSPSPS